MKSLGFLGWLLVIPWTGACAGDGATRQGVGAACESNADCETEDLQRCLTEFKAGYCGVAGCAGDLDCPDGSRCVGYAPGTNYCFLECTETAECNANRPLGAEAECTAELNFIDGKLTKACLPPAPLSVE